MKRQDLFRNPHKKTGLFIYVIEPSIGSAEWDIWLIFCEKAVSLEAVFLALRDSSFNSFEGNSAVTCRFFQAALVGPSGQHLQLAQIISYR